MYNLDAPFILGSSQKMSELMVEIPTSLSHSVLGPFKNTAEVIRTRQVDRRHPYKLALANTIRSAITSGDDFTVKQQEVLQVLQSVLGVADSGATQSYLLAAEAFIRQNLSSTELTVGLVAQHLNVSERHLSRIFEQHGTTPRNYIQDQRVEAAAQKLADGSSTQSIAQIATECGFATQQHFSRVFKMKFDLTPTAWRQEQSVKSS